MSADTRRPDTWQAAFDLIRTRGYEHREEPFRLASGQLSHDYIDGKYAIDTGDRLRVVSQAIADLAAMNGIEFDAVGGLTMGADSIAIGVAMVTGKAWFSVRKEQKQRGREQWIEGTRLTPGTRVLLVDDVISTGGSTEIAFDRVTERAPRSDELILAGDLVERARPHPVGQRRGPVHGGDGLLVVEEGHGVPLRLYRAGRQRPCRPRERCRKAS